MIHGKLVFNLYWNNWNGAEFSRTFDTEKERADFIPRIVKKDRNGNVNYYTWETDIIRAEETV